MSALFFITAMFVITYFVAGSSGLLLASLAPAGARKSVATRC